MRPVADALAAIPEVDYVVICAGGYDLLAELVCTDDDHLLDLLNDAIRAIPGRHGHGDVHLSEARQADLCLGDPMSDHSRTHLSAAAARDHLWMHFTRLSAYPRNAPVPVIVRGDGPYIWDPDGKRYLDGLSGLFVVQAGHGRQELADAAAKQAAELAYFPLWSYAHPTGDRARRPAGRPRARRPQPGLLHHRRLGGGGERVEARPQLLQAGRQADEDQGDLPGGRLPRHHAWARCRSPGIPAIKQDFEPLIPARSGCRTPTTTGARTSR